VLVAAGGHPVSTESLIDKLWDADRRPDKPREQVYEYVSKLRRALRDGAAGHLIPGHDGGYRIVVDRAHVDLYRFTDLVARARAVAGRDDPSAAALLREALRQWGPDVDGEPLAGLAGPWASNFRLTLREQRRHAQLTRLETELRLGHHDDVVPELTRLCGLDPPDEQVAGLLMRALYRAGRQVEALDVYPRVRRRLLAFGAEPGRDLERLHRLVANQDPSLGPPTTPAPPPPRPAPAPPPPRAAPGGAGPRLFVSYAHADIGYTGRLCAHLAAHGLPVWYDWHLEWGEDFAAAIPELIRDACGIIVVMSPASARSRFVSLEILEGQVRNRWFLPILLDGDCLFLLRSTGYFDARGGVLPGQRELGRLRELCGRRPGAAPPPPRGGPVDLPFPGTAGPLPRAAEPPPPVPPDDPPVPPDDPPVAPDDPPVAPDDPPVAPDTDRCPRSDRPDDWLDELVRLLAHGRLGPADLLTTSVILASVGRLDDGWIPTMDSRRLPVSLLGQLDRVWRDGSAGRYGFTRQLGLHDRPPVRPAQRASRDTVPASAPTGGSEDFYALADALRWRLDGREVIPRHYGEFVACTRYPGGYPAAFFPTLRNAQVEQNKGWLDQWRQSVMATQLALRRAGGGFK
jgi:DNA-binding SARP family transcriptional activator